MTGKKRAPKALLKDLKEVFEKHNWPGTVVGTPAAALTSTAGNCPPGKTPHDVTFQTPQGTWVTTTVCL